MKVTLEVDTTVAINGINVTLSKGTKVELACDTREHALELCAVAKLPVDLSYTEGSVRYVAGANGVFVAQEDSEVVLEIPEAPKKTKAKAKK